MAKRKRDLKYEYSPAYRDQRAGESDYDYYKSIAKTANIKMTNLEKLSESDPRFENILKYAYKNAMYDIRHISGDVEAVRFDYDIPKKKNGEINQAELRRRTNAVKRFLESPSSTKSGTIEVYKKRAQTINKEFGYDEEGRRRKDWKNLTWEDLAKYYESGIAEINDAQQSSRTEMRALGAIKRISKKPEKIRAAAAGDLRVSDNDVINAAAVEMLKNGLPVDEIFKTENEE